MHHVYLDEPGAVGAVVRMNEDEAKHAVKVLRMSAGEAVCAIDPDGRRFAAVLKDESSVRLTEALPDNEPPVRITLYQGLPKADKLEFIAQKLTELGAGALVPVKMERCVVKSDAKDGAKRKERLEKISKEAVKQCRRGRPLEVSAPLTWKETAARLAAHDLVLIPWEDEHSRTMKQVYAEAPDAKNIAVIVGPEGGMSAEEVAKVQAVPVTLGARILRAETAAVAAVTIVQTLWGDIG